MQTNKNLPKSKIHEWFFRSCMVFCFGIVFLGYENSAIATSSADLANMKNCYNPADSKTAANVKVCAETAAGAMLVYPDLIQKAKTNPPSPATIVKINGCYDFSFRRVKDIPGDPISGRCMDSDAPIRVYLRFRTNCSNGGGTCTYGGQVLVIPEIILDGPHSFGDGFKPKVTDGLPIVVSKGTATYTAYESCEVLEKPLPDGTPSGYSWDPTTQSCKKSPKKVCTEIGFYWSDLDEKCVSSPGSPLLTVHGKTVMCEPSKCALDLCTGESYKPLTNTPDDNCFCPGASPLLDRNLASSSSDDKSSCKWLHYEVQMNPTCQEWNDPVEYVADPNMPILDRCCINGVCDGVTNLSDGTGSSTSAFPSATSNTTAKVKADNAGIPPRNFYQIGPTDKYPVRGGDPSRQPGSVFDVRYVRP